jgi:uncharacterized cupin superfamily protein
MVREAQLQDVGSGLAPASGGWFVVNARDAAWLSNAAFGARCVFESAGPVLRRRPDVAPQRFADLGLTLDVVWPGQPSGLYHAESRQEDFLVLAGECVLLIEEQRRSLSAWDFVHCPAETAHVFIGAGDGPCVILMTGARASDKRVRYPRSEPALQAGAGVSSETDVPGQAYADRPPWQPERPADWHRLPWAR